jgi:hypothetical protein
VVVDALELELRQLAGVTFVGFGERGGALVVQLVTDGDVDEAEIRERAMRLAQAHIEGEVVVEVGQSRGGSAGRVQLMAVLPWPEDNAIEVHLSRSGRNSVGRATRGGPEDAAAATLEALRGLGVEVPFSVSAAVPLEATNGHGVVVVALTGSGEARHGVAAGSSLEEAGARATLHALNRWLEGAA